MTDSRDRWNAVLELIQAGRFLEAETALRKLAEQAGLPEQGHEILARLSYNRAASIWEADLATAESLLREAMQLAPELPNARAGLAEILVRRAAAEIAAQAWAAAAAAATEALTLWPEIGAALTDPVRTLAEELRRGAIRITGAQPDLAARLALSAWRLRPEDPGLYAVCRSLFVHLGLAGHGPAIDASTFEAALRENPSDLVARLGLANIRRHARRLHEAEQLCRDALQFHPDNPFAAGRLASILFSASRTREASELFQGIGQSHDGIESVIRLTPDFFDTLRAEAGDPLSAAVSHASPDLVVFAGCDGKYFHRFADGLANSVASNCPSALLHFHIVDPDAGTETRIAAARARWPGLDIRVTSEQAPRALQGDALSTYFACARFLFLPDLLRRYRCPLLMLDVDAVVLRNPQPLIDQLRTEKADFGLVRGEQDDPWSRYWADVILAFPSDLSLDYFGLVRDYIAHFVEHDRGIWFLDQVALCAARVAGFDRRPAPRIIDWPSDIQNSDTRLAYFWSLHMSQPNNADLPESTFYLSFKNAET